MFQWFAQLPPGEQLALICMVIGNVFSLGVYAATVRFLTKRVGEHDVKLETHDDKLEKHGEEIAALKAARN